MQIGLLRHRVQFQTLVRSANRFQTPDAWTTYGTYWARVEALVGKEVYQVGIQNMKVSHKITIRYPGATCKITAGDRAVYNNRNFEIQQGLVNTDERNILLEIFAFELDPNQGGLSPNGN